MVQGDAVLLGAVVNNLLINALRYGPRSDCEVRIDARRERAHWQISVTSQGPTISMQAAPASSSPTVGGPTSVASRVPDWA